MIYTAYFANRELVNLEDCVYLSIAVGNPKYPVPYTITDCKMLKPYGVFGKYHGDQYRIKYYERLENYGVARISKEIAQLQGSHKNVVLLCHERNKYDCHRLMFAEWWEEKTGQKIPEYAEAEGFQPKKKKEEKKPEKKEEFFEDKQLTMFGLLGV